MYWMCQLKKMTTWIDNGSKEDTYLKNKDKLHAYVTWIGYDLSTIKVADAFVQFHESKWNTIYKHWAISLISKQSQSRLNIMRETYTKKTGIDWKLATLDNVYETLGWCHEMFINKVQTLS